MVRLVFAFRWERKLTGSVELLATKKDVRMLSVASRTFADAPFLQFDDVVPIHPTSAEGTFRSFFLPASF